MQEVVGSIPFASTRRSGTAAAGPAGRPPATRQRFSSRGGTGDRRQVSSSADPRGGPQCREADQRRRARRFRRPFPGRRHHRRSDGPGGRTQAGVEVAAGCVLLDRMKQTVAARESFCLETTLAGQNAGRWVCEWREAGSGVRLVFVALADPGVAVRRVAGRVADAGHDVPEVAIRRRSAGGRRYMRCERRGPRPRCPGPRWRADRGADGAGARPLRSPSSRCPRTRAKP
jgi:hypothetical protein